MYFKMLQAHRYATPPPQASTAPNQVSLEEGGYTHSRERACMFAREIESFFSSMAEGPTEAGWDISTCPLKHLEITAADPQPLQ